MGEMPADIERWGLTKDQKYLYGMVQSINNGVCDQNLATIKPGKLNKARWLTTASRILRLYMTKSKPSKKLKLLVTFIVKIYAPFWFLVKSRPKAIHGSRHIFQYIQWTRVLPENARKIVQKSVQYNGFFCHPENILLSMITDENKEVRIAGYDKILEARDRPSVSVRTFTIPKINFDCTSYPTMIDWSSYTEPPCIQFMPQQNLVEFHDSDEIIAIPGENLVATTFKNSFKLF